MEDQQFKEMQSLIDIICLQDDINKVLNNNNYLFNTIEHTYP